MTEEKIHEALNLLDDNLIAEVEFLRARKKRETKKWIGWAAMAACMCVVAGSVFAAFADRFFNFGANEGAGMEGESELIYEQESLSKDENKMENESMQEVPAFGVEIVEWHEDGFVGTIVEIIDTDIYPVGTEVYVNMTWNSQLADMNISYPVGSVLHVQFNRMGEGEQIILYAEQIWEIVTE